MRRFIQSTPVVLGLTLALVLASGLGRAAGLEEARTALEQWVKTRQVISQTQTEWSAEKETLGQGLELLQRELQTIETQFAGVSTNSVQVDKERLQAEESLQASQAALQRIEQFATALQQEVTQLLPRLPAPLQDLIKPFLNRLPVATAATRVTGLERVQALVGALNELDKFNNSVSVFSEKRKNAQGAELSVQTVYVGLGAAYFVNETGDFAGTGSPGPDGWEWTVKPELGGAIQEVLRIYRNEKPARFIPLPARIR